MNSRGESIFLPDDLAVQGARKVGYNKGWNDRKFQDLGIIEEATMLGEESAYEIIPLFFKIHVGHRI
jgi:hypothetical protein